MKINGNYNSLSKQLQIKTAFLSNALHCYLKIFLCLFCCQFLPTLGYVKADTLLSGPILNGLTLLKIFNTQVHTATGTFEQRQLNNNWQELNKSFGVFSFMRPGKFIWAINKPYEQLLQSDGNRFYVWDKDLNQVSVYNAGLNNQLISDSPSAILFGKDNLDKHFNLRQIQNEEVKNSKEFNRLAKLIRLEKNIHLIEMKPINENSTFTKIVIGLQLNDFKQISLKNMILYDALNNINIIIFGDVKINTLIKDDVFNFKIPNGADVINHQ